MSRESVEVALFNLLKNSLSGSFTTIGRKHVMPPTLGIEMQPALFLSCVKETKMGGPRGLPGKQLITFYLFAYCTDTSGDEIPGTETALAATKLNTLKDAIDTALAPDPVTGVLTLGGTVSHCWVEGDTDSDPGIFSKQALAIIPVHVLVP